jgi:hypothetical protein
LLQSLPNALGADSGAGVTEDQAVGGKVVGVAGKHGPKIDPMARNRHLAADVFDNWTEYIQSLFDGVIANWVGVEEVDHVLYAIIGHLREQTLGTFGCCLNGVALCGHG